MSIFDNRAFAGYAIRRRTVRRAGSRGREEAERSIEIALVPAVSMAGESMLCALLGEE